MVVVLLTRAPNDLQWYSVLLTRTTGWPSVVPNVPLTRAKGGPSAVRRVPLNPSSSRVSVPNLPQIDLNTPARDASLSPSAAAPLCPLAAGRLSRLRRPRPHLAPPPLLSLLSRPALPRASAVTGPTPPPSASADTVHGPERRRRRGREHPRHRPPLPRCLSVPAGSISRGSPPPLRSGSKRVCENANKKFVY